MRFAIGCIFALIALVGFRGSTMTAQAATQTIPAREGQVTDQERAWAKLSSGIVDFCNKNIGKYRNAIAVLKTPVVVPVPPAIKPGCSQCGGNTADDSQRLADDWFKKAEQPETNATRDLLSILRVLTLAGLASDDGDTSNLSPAARTCVAQFHASSIAEDVSQLIERQYSKKAVPMASTYKKDPERARAGIPFYLAAARQYALWSGGNNQTGNLQVVGEWIDSVMASYDGKIFKEHLYYWCPSYLQLLRQNALLNNGDTTLGDRVLKTAKRIEDFMHFKVRLDVSVIGNGQHSHMNVHWTGESELALAVDFGKACYTPQLQNNKIDMSIDTFVMQGQDGDAELLSPKNFSAAVSGVKLNLCGENPTADIVFKDFGPPVTFGHGAARGTAPLFQNIMIAAIVDAKKKNGTLGTQTQSLKDKMQALKDQIAKHAHDQAWLMSPEGQRAIAQIQGYAMGGAAENPGTLSQAPMIGHITNELEVPWGNGTPNVTDKTLTVDNDDGHITVHVTIVHDPKNNSETGT